MKLARPVHFWLIVIATAIFLLIRWVLGLGEPGLSFSGTFNDGTFVVACQSEHAAKWAAVQVNYLTYYLAFCVVVLGHAVCSQSEPSQVK